MRIILPITFLAALAASTGAFAQTAARPIFPDAIAGDYNYSADATRGFYRLEGGAHATAREESGTSSWEGSGRFGGNPNGN